MIAVQGPRALETLQPLFDQPLEPVPLLSLDDGPAAGQRRTPSSAGPATRARTASS